MLAGQEILLCRATLKVGKSLFTEHTVKYVATASSGIDHIDSELLEGLGIGLLDAKGCNAQAVADYVVCTLAWLRERRNFTGKNAVVIGAGAVGSRVYLRLKKLGLNVLSYDPLREEWDSSFKSCHFNDLFDADLVSLHANLHALDPYPSFHLLDRQFFSSFNSKGVIINAARGHIVNEQTLLNHPEICYCTDVYSNEPEINSKIIELAAICTPHIAGHSIEAKQRAVQIISQKLHALYALPFQPNPESHIPLNNLHAETWEQLVLSLYNPELETSAFKKAFNKQTAFLELRKSHPARHDFNYYQFPDNSHKELLQLAGIDG